ncbi:kelch domain-containing protein 1 [Esox lucius]|uniref:Kelch domain containing 1 n=1 Tax=Esox lucius TaxID=8010 RepID=A0A3P8ZJ00_ESOLU|nr:kelch domain-containing protein 1 [Esox lucius]XP_019902249.1 kelch domain-containing protein 1 [Esox lucius]
MMDSRTGVEILSSLERSDHTAFVDGNVLYVWGGCQSVSGSEIMLPSDEIWLCDLESGAWERRGIEGEPPPALSGACGSYHNGSLYVFGGCDPNGHTNQLYSASLLDGCYTWKRVKDAQGNTPSPRDKHTCWVHRDRLIYFGGYGCKTIREVNNSKSFAVDETSWATIGTVSFRFWGWNNEVHVFDPSTVTWSEPETHGLGPAPRASHASATLRDKGYICGGLEDTALDIHCLDLDTWTWTQIDLLSSLVPVGRSMHTLTPVSDHTLFLFGGLSISGNPLNDGWEFNVQTKTWSEMNHRHHDKPRLWHSACPGKDQDVVVFGGSQEYVLLMDSLTVLRSPSQKHCKDVLVFQTQPYPLLRLCEDCIGRHADVLQVQLSWLPPKLQETIDKRVFYFRTLQENRKLEELILD